MNARKEAAIKYERAIKVDRKYAEAWSNLGYTYKEIQPRANPPKADSNWPKISIPALRINVDNKANFRYPDD